ncbi:MAG: sterol desaturase family protein [Flavobacteriales bacterium]
MADYPEIIINAYTGYFNYLVGEVTHPGWHNYFYGLSAVSLIAWVLEMAFPWRRDQGLFRRDFWLDAFYMYFNFFLFSLLVYNALSNVSVAALRDALAVFGFEHRTVIDLRSLPNVVQLLILFVLSDFVQWLVHRLLHRVPLLWQFHKVHHSVREMGFAAHLRFHWVETIVYKSVLFIPFTLIGYGASDFFVVHIVQIIIGHLNHANISLSYGIFGYLLNNPAMHIWHHARELPEIYGVNFGISLSLWDYVFGTAYVPCEGRDIELGFPGDENFPQAFTSQIIYPARQGR